MRAAPQLTLLAGLHLPLSGDTRIGSCRQKMNSINCVNTHVRNPLPLRIKLWHVMPQVRCVPGLLAPITGVRVRMTRTSRGSWISTMAVRTTSTRSTTCRFVQSGLFSPSSLHLFCFRSQLCSAGVPISREALLNGRVMLGLLSFRMEPTHWFNELLARGPKWCAVCA